MFEVIGVQLLSFILIFGGLALTETALPRRNNPQRGARWPGIMGLILTGNLLGRVLIPGGTVAAAILAQDLNIGLFQQISLPLWVSLGLSILLLDGLIWAQHVVLHRVPLLWRIHRVHHLDPSVDVATGLRFHPLEILLSLCIRCLAVLALGITPLAAASFEIVLMTASLFEHSNIKLSSRLDALIRLLVVTPDMHRVHHSSVPRETNSNYGFFLSIWDRLAGTYIAQPESGHDQLTPGLAGPGNQAHTSTGYIPMLLDPLASSRSTAVQR